MDTHNKKEQQTAYDSTFQKEAEDSRNERYIDDCRKFSKLMERNIKTLRAISYLDRLEELCHELADDEDQFMHPDFYNFSFSEYAGLARLLIFWNEYIPQSIICFHSEQSQKLSKSKPKQITVLATFDIKSKLRKKTKRASIFGLNDISKGILFDFLAKQIGEMCCKIVFNMYQILLTIDKRDLSLIPEDPLIPKEAIEACCKDGGDDVVMSGLPMGLFYKDLCQVYYWDGLFGEISEQVGDLFYDALDQCYKLGKSDYACFVIKHGISDAFNLLKQSEQAIKGIIWMGKNGDEIYSEICYVICYTICLYRNSNDTNRLIPILNEGITPDTIQRFEYLWNKLKQYSEWREKSGFTINELRENIRFQHLDTLDKAIDFLKYVGSNTSEETQKKDDMPQQLDATTWQIEEEPEKESAKEPNANVYFTPINNTTSSNIEITQNNITINQNQIYNNQTINNNPVNDKKDIQDEKDMTCQPMRDVSGNSCKEALHDYALEISGTANLDKKREPDVRPEEEIIQQEDNDVVTSTDTFNLNLSEEFVKSLFKGMKDRFIDKTAYALFSYILTGKGKPDNVGQINWKASPRSFALFIGVLCYDRNRQWEIAKKHFTGKMNKNPSSDYKRIAKKFDIINDRIPKDFSEKSDFINEKDKYVKEMLVLLSNIKRSK